MDKISPKCTWLGINDEHGRDHPLFLRMVEAENKDEAILKLFESHFFDSIIGNLYDHMYCTFDDDEWEEDEEETPLDFPLFEEVCEKYSYTYEGHFLKPRKIFEGTVDKIIEEVPDEEIIGIMKCYMKYNKEMVFSLNDIGLIK